MDFPLARQAFYREIHQADDQIDLARAALYLAQEDYPELDVEEYLNALDTMAAELADQLPAEPYPLRIIRQINQYLFEDLKFVGNEGNYYDPRNSFLNEVLDRRTGIPITLSLVYLEVARRVDFPMVGIGMPGHFLIRPDREEMEIFVDPFHKGEILFLDDCKERIAKLFKAQMPFQPEFLNAIGPRHFLARMLGNLKLIYLDKGDAKRALAAIERILLLFPEAPMEMRDRGLLYYHLGQLTAARQDLENYLTELPSANDRTVIHKVLERIDDQIS